MSAQSKIIFVYYTFLQIFGIPVCFFSAVCCSYTTLLVRGCRQVSLLKATYPICIYHQDGTHTCIYHQHGIYRVIQPITVQVTLQLVGTDC